MAEYRTVRMGFWNDPYIEGLDAKSKLLYLYLFTGPYTNNLGIMEVTRRKISYETGLTQPEIDKYLEALQAAGKVICDPDHNLIFLTNFIRHQTSTSPKILQGLMNITQSICSPIIARALCIRYPEVYGVSKDDGDTLTIPYSNGKYTLSIPSGEIGSWKGEDGRGKEEGEERKNTPPRKEPQDVKESFGEYGNVRLTPEEHERLCLDYGVESTQEAIIFLDLHLGAKRGGDPYKSHNLAMRKWVFDAVQERKGKQPARASPPHGSQSKGLKASADDMFDELRKELDPQGGDDDDP